MGWNWNSQEISPGTHWTFYDGKWMQIWHLSKFLWCIHSISYSLHSITYPLVIRYIVMERSTMLFMRKLTLFMAMFHSYVCLPMVFLWFPYGFVIKTTRGYSLPLKSQQTGLSGSSLPEDPEFNLGFTNEGQAEISTIQGFSCGEKWWFNTV